MIYSKDFKLPDLSKDLTSYRDELPEASVTGDSSALPEPSVTGAAFKPSQEEDLLVALNQPYRQEVSTAIVTYLRTLANEIEAGSVMVEQMNIHSDVEMFGAGEYRQCFQTGRQVLDCTYWKRGS